MFFISLLLWWAVVFFSSTFATEFTEQTNDRMYVRLSDGKSCLIGYIDKYKNCCQLIDEEREIILSESDLYVIRQSHNCLELSIKESDKDKSVMIFSDFAPLKCIAQIFNESNLVDTTKKLICEFLMIANNFQEALGHKRKINLTQRTLPLLQLHVSYIYNQRSACHADTYAILFAESLTKLCTKIYKEQKISLQNTLKQNESLLSNNTEDLTEHYLIIAGCILLLFCTPFTYLHPVKKATMQEFCLQALIGCCIWGGLMVHSVKTITSSNYYCIKSENNNISDVINKQEKILQEMENLLTEKKKKQEKTEEKKLDDFGSV